MVFILRISGSFRLMASLCLALAALSMLLYGVLGFDPATSPAWQLVPYFLVLLLLFVLPLGLASQQGVLYDGTVSIPALLPGVAGAGGGFGCELVPGWPVRGSP